MPTPSEKKMDRSKMLRYIYLYLVTVITIILLIISSIGFIDLFLRNYVLNVKDYAELEDPYECADDALFYNYGPNGEKLPKKAVMTDTEKTQTKDECMVKAMEKRHLQAVNQMKRDIAWDLAMLLVSLPLYLYHWGIIKKDSKKQ
jgi:hypothetical protein